MLRKSPPLLIDTEGIDTKNKDKIKWIECDTCSQRIHAQCSGIEEEELKSLPKKGLWFKCAICSVVSLELINQKTNQGLEKLTQQAVEARFEAIQPTLEPLTNPEISNKDTKGTGSSSSTSEGIDIASGNKGKKKSKELTEKKDKKRQVLEEIKKSKCDRTRE